MNGKNIKFLIIVVGLCCMVVGVLVGILGTSYFAGSQYRILSNLAQEFIEQYPQDEQKIVRIIKENSYVNDSKQEFKQDYLSVYGYEARDFVAGYIDKMLLISVAAVVIILLLLYCLFQLIRKIQTERITGLTDYLTKLNMGRDVTLLPAKEDCFSELQDEIYKTVTNLYHTREAALNAKKNYADNLANIAHQIKTPLTSMSIMTQLLKREWEEEYVRQIQKQIERLTRLTETLLMLSRIDAGVLDLEKKQVDVYTILQLSVEALENIRVKRNINIQLENHEEICFQGDMEWTMEAFINLIKNCIEHARGTVGIDYSQNPIYTEIKVWDDGEGFSRNDISHIFERFYHGERSCEGGIGIGLALAKSIIEMQNGCIEAKNLVNSGACYLVKIYSH